MKRIILIIMVGLFLVGCATQQTAKPALTYGAVKKHMVKGVTTQAEIIELFGSPNITTKSKGGDEVWTYDQVSYVGIDESGPRPEAILIATATGGAVGAILGHQLGHSTEGAAAGLFTGAAIGSQFQMHSSGSGTKTVTLMLWFDENDLVKDYSIITTAY